MYSFCVTLDGAVAAARVTFEPSAKGPPRRSTLSFDPTGWEAQSMKGAAGIAPLNDVVTGLPLTLKSLTPRRITTHRIAADVFIASKSG